MDTTREPELEQVQQAPAAPTAVPSTPAGLLARPFSPSGVMALQRLVGNAAVAGMIADQVGGSGFGSIGGAVAEAANAGAGTSATEAAEGGVGAAAGEAAQAAAGGGVGAAAGEAAQAAAGGVGAAAGEAAQGVAGGVGAAAGQAAPGVAGGVGAAAAEAAQGVAGGVGAAAGQAALGVAGGVGAAAAEAAQGVAGGVGAATGQAALGVAGGVGAAAAEAAQGVAGGVGAAAGQAAQGVAGGVGAAAAGAAQAGAAGAGGATAASARAAGGAAGAASGGAAAGATQTAAGGGGAAGGAPGAAGSAAAAPAQAGGGGAAGGGAAGAAAPAPRRDPSEDPNFQAMKGKAGAAGGKAKAHQPAAAGAAAAQAAAVPPGNEVASQAAGAQVEEMGAQQPGTFDRKAFIAAVQKAIDAAAPKNLEEADDFKGSGKAAQVKGEVGQLVKGGKKDAEKDIKTATDAPPDASKAKPKDVTPLAPEKPGEATAGVGAANAMPGPRPPEETDLSAGPAQVDEEMEREGVTEEQLANSNEPDFTAALDARQTAKEHSATAPGEYRAQEQEVLAKGRDEAADVEGAGLTGMHGTKVAALAKVVSQQGEAKSQDEAKRAKVAADIQAIYDKTKTDVTGILTGLDGKVDSAFTSGEESARKQFEEYVGAKMDAYKDDRYSGWLGGARWLKDKLFGMPDEVNVFYSQGRSAYLTAMDAVIGQVADIVGGELNAARMRIAQGRTEVRNYVMQLPQDLQKVGKDAEGKLEEQFDQLSSDVDAKQDALVDTLAQKYVASRDALDSRIEELKAANKGLVDKALDAVVGVVKTILKLKDMLLNVLAKAADVIGDIISDPIGFLSNLIGGIKDGLGRFVDNISTHLKEGLMGWLFGALGDAGIKMPKSFDLAGIFELVMDVLGLTYRNIRGRVAKVVGEPVVEKMEQTVDVFKMLVTDGPAALWNWIKDKVGDFQEMVFGGLKDFIIERVIKGGVMWLLSLLNPAAAFIKACKAIYDIVMFIVERGSQIMEFVNSVIDSIGAIARGQLSVAAEKVEGALARALPLAISFLASLLGLSGVTDKIRESIDKVRKPIEKAVDFVVLGAVKGFKKMFGGAIGWVKGKYEKGKKFVKDKATAAKEWGAGKVQGIKDRLTGKAPDDGEHQVGAGEVGAAAAPTGTLDSEEIDVAPDEHHTLTAEGDGKGGVQLVVHSTPQLVPDLLLYYGRNVDRLPERVTEQDVPEGGRVGEQPRQRAGTLIEKVQTRYAAVAGEFSRGIDAHRALHKTASGVPGTYVPDPELTGKMNKLAHDIRDLLRLFHVDGGDEFALEAGEPEDNRAQKMTARVTVLQRPKEKVLPETDGRLRGLDPDSPQTGDARAIASDPHLVQDGRKRARGVVYSGVQNEPAPGEGGEAVERDVVVRTWAIGGKPPKGSNASHTENLFRIWFDEQGEEFHSRVVAIELRSVFSMCGDCVNILEGISSKLEKRAPGAPAATKVVFWEAVWGEEVKRRSDGSEKKPPAAHTTQVHVQRLGDAGWIVHGPGPSV